MVCAWTGVGVTNSFLSRLFRNAEQRLSSEKCFINCVRFFLRRTGTFVSFRIAALRKCLRLETRRSQSRPCRIHCVFQKLPGYGVVGSQNNAAAEWLPIIRVIRTRKHPDCTLVDPVQRDRSRPALCPAKRFWRRFRHAATRHILESIPREFRSRAGRKWFWPTAVLTSVILPLAPDPPAPCLRSLCPGSGCHQCSLAALGSRGRVRGPPNQSERHRYSSGHFRLSAKTDQIPNRAHNRAQKQPCRRLVQLACTSPRICSIRHKACSVLLNEKSVFVRVEHTISGG